MVLWGVRKKVGKWLGGLGNMIERQDKIELDIQEIKKDIENMKKDNVKDKVSFADLLKKDIAKEPLDRDKGLEEVVSGHNAEREFQVQLNEAMERDKRRNNLVIMGAVDDTVDQTQELISGILEVLLQDSVEFTLLGLVTRWMELKYDR